MQLDLPKRLPVFSHHRPPVIKHVYYIASNYYSHHMQHEMAEVKLQITKNLN